MGMNGKNTPAGEQNAKTHLRRVLMWGAAAVVLIAVSVIILIFDPFGKSGEAPAVVVGPSMAPNVQIGVMPGKTLEELQAVLDAKTAKSEISFTVNTTVEFIDGWQGEGNFMFECLPSNQNYIEFVLSRDDTGEEIYRTGLMAPNQYILTDFLKTKTAMPEGAYQCTVEISSYDMETFELIGKVQAGVTLTMLK